MMPSSACRLQHCENGVLLLVRGLTRSACRLQSCAETMGDLGQEFLAEFDDKWPRDMRFQNAENGEPSLWLQDYIPQHLQRNVWLVISSELA